MALERPIITLHDRHDQTLIAVRIAHADAATDRPRPNYKGATEEDQQLTPNSQQPRPSWGPLGTSAEEGRGHRKLGSKPARNTEVYGLNGQC